MSEFRADRILKPEYFRLRPLVKNRSKRPPYIIGWDSEAEKGYPFCYQFAHPDKRVHIIEVPKTGRKYETLFPFLRYLYLNCPSTHSYEYLVFGFNLNYEYTQLFRDLADETVAANEIELEGTFPLDVNEIQHVEFRMNVLNVKREAITLYLGKGKRPIKIIDANAYVNTSLDKAAKMLGFGAKEEKPKQFARSMLNDPEFRKYAETDAILTQLLGEWIVDLHQKYNVTQTISAPHFASNVFRRAFLHNEIPFPHPELEQAGLSSYHGGKNGFYKTKPTYIKHCYHVDIRSAYPEAMRQLPDIEKGAWTYSLEYIPKVHAIWHVRGQYKRCKYRALMDANSWPQTGYFDGYVTSYELDQAIEHEEFAIESCEGDVFDGPNGGPLVKYVDKFYAMKRDAKDPTLKATAKLFLNSLYGKFFQKTALGNVGVEEIGPGADTVMYDPDQEYDYVAGGLYHPPIASLITGYVRAKIHRLEHQLTSIMTSTDGLFTYHKPPDDMIGEELGDLSMEKGTLRIWRERMYLFEAEDGSISYAMHGFRGSLDDLKQIPLTPGNIWHYMANTMIGLKISRRQLRGKKYEAGEFVMLPYTVALPGKPPGPAP